MDREYGLPWTVHIEQQGIFIRNVDGNEVCSLSIRNPTPTALELRTAELIVTCINAHAKNEVRGLRS